MIALKLETAAAALDMDIREFLEAVRGGDLPMPVCFAGVIRWIPGDFGAFLNEEATSNSLNGMMEVYGIID